MFYKAAIVLGIIFLSTCDAITLNGKNKIVFPQQYRLLDESLFMRQHNGDFELLKCPNGFRFSQKDLKCNYVGRRIKIDTYLKKFTTNDCPSNLRGRLSNPMNCRKYINCWDGIGYIQECAAHLLYSNVTDTCNWPEETACCEYWEKNSNKLVM